MLVRCVCMRHTYINVSFEKIKYIDIQNKSSRLHGTETPPNRWGTKMVKYN